MNWVSITSCNDLSPNPREAITWTNADLLSIIPLGTNISEIRIKIQNFSFMKMHLKMSPAKWQPFCSGQTSEPMRHDTVLFIMETAVEELLDRSAKVIATHLKIGCSSWNETAPGNPLYLQGLTWIPTWISNCTYYKMWDEITHSFPNFNGATVDVWEWKDDFIPHFTGLWLLIHIGIKVNPW